MGLALGQSFLVPMVASLQMGIQVRNRYGYGTPGLHAKVYLQGTATEFLRLRSVRTVGLWRVEVTTIRFASGMLRRMHIK